MVAVLIDTNTGDLLLDGGSLAIGDSEAQTAEIVVRTFRGDLKEQPLLGGEVVRQLGGGVDVMWAGEVREMLKACGVTCSCVKIVNDTVTVM